VLTRDHDALEASTSVVTCYKCKETTDSLKALDSAEPVRRLTPALDNNSSHDVECDDSPCDSYHKLDSTSTEPIASLTPVVLDNNASHEVECSDESPCDKSNIDTSTLCSPQECQERALPSDSLQCNIKCLNDVPTSTNIHEHSLAGISTPSPHSYPVESESNDDPLLSTEITASVNTVESTEINFPCEPDKKTPLSFISSLLGELCEKTLEPTYSEVVVSQKMDHGFPDLRSDPHRVDDIFSTNQIDGITNCVFRIVDNVLKCVSTGQFGTMGSSGEQLLGGLIIRNNCYSVVSNYSKVCISDSPVVNSTDIGTNTSKLVDIDVVNCQSECVNTNRGKVMKKCSVDSIDLSMSSVATHVLNNDEQTLTCTKSESESIISFHRGNACDKTIGKEALQIKNDKIDDLVQIKTTPCSVKKDFQKEHLKQETNDSIASDAMQSQQVVQIDFDDNNDDIVNNEPVDEPASDVTDAQSVDKNSCLQGAILDLILCSLDASQQSRKTCCHQCLVCPRIFRYIGGLARHERSHTDRLPYAGRMQTRKNVVVNGSHSEKDDTEKAEASNEDKDKYSEKEESEDEPTHLCHYCYKEFDTRCKLNRHVNRIHRGGEILKHSNREVVILDSMAVQLNSFVVQPTPANCACQAIKLQTEGLHQVEDQRTRGSALAVDQGQCKAAVFTNLCSDNNDFQHECTICWAKFTDHIDLESHKKLHMPQQSWLCGVCPENFKTESYLRSHYYLEHRRDNIFSCTFCSFKNSKFKDYGSHAQTHRRETVYVHNL